MELFTHINRINCVGPRLPRDYPIFLRQLKDRIQAARVKAVLSVNREMIALYWDLGRQVVERQKKGGWGTSIIERISRDIQAEFPGIKGFSRKNIQYMRAFYCAWPGIGPNLQKASGDLGDIIWQKPSAKFEIWQHPVAKLPWWHNISLLEKLKTPKERLWYARQALEHGWSRNVLAHQIDSGLHLRQGKALTNFKKTLRGPGDGPTIGIILCRSRNKVVAEYALSDLNKPIGVSSYRLTKALPEALAASLPSTSELEDKLR